MFPSSKPGPPALLVFFKTSCPTCRWALPYFEQLHRLAGAEVLSVIGIAEDDEADLAPIAQELRLTFPVALEPAPYATSTAYEVMTVPTLFYIRDARIELESAGFARGEVLEIARRAAALAGTDPVSSFLDGVAEFRPG
ncbi:MAG TPA: TlpA disulfide reductase family protein [bacterium]|nr:TlpA disulfide reductase family protein [bacterium]